MANKSVISGPVILFTKADREWLDDFSKRSQAHVDKVTKTKESAMQDLVNAGIYDKSGKLSKQYR